MARQFRSDDTSPWFDRFGSGVDGAYTPSTSTDAPIDSACTGTSGATSLSATNVSFAVGQTLLIHQTQGTGAGSWELNRVASYSTGTITLSYTLQNTYVSGAQVLVLKQYPSVNIAGGVTLTAKAWNGTTGGILGWLCSGITTITGTLSASGKGFRGGAANTTTGQGWNGEGYTGASSQSFLTNGSGGAGGSAASGGGGGSGNGGGGGQVGNDGVPSAGSIGGVAELTTLFLGGGGGGGGDTGGIAQAGGAGGGILLLITKSYTITGALTANGAVGGASPSGFNRGGGGGGAGHILIKGQNLTLGTNLITSVGGAGGYNGGLGGNGGAAGAGGRIHDDYVSSITGTTTPTIDTRQDLSLADQGGGALLSFV